MTRDVDPKSFLPGFVGEYREIKEILRAETPELRAAADAAETARDFSFIIHCGEDGLARFERIMGVFPSSEDTLSERRARIIIRWNEELPYTMAALRKKLAAICGSVGFSIGGDPDKYLLEIKASLSHKNQLEELERLLDRIVPANMVIIVRNELTPELSSELYVGGAIGTSKLFVINSSDA